ncbi:MAG: MgtC/SapB family protein [Mangrovibacterium sp.]
MDIQNYIPEEIINFFLVLIFSLLIGLGQRRHHLEDDDSRLFGTDRTFTFIGLLGYVLYISDPNGFIPFLTGFFVVGLLLGIQYFQKIKLLKDFGLTTSVLALLTYCLAVLVYTQPVWLVLSFVVSILILTELKGKFKAISKKASEEEFITLAKFIAFAGIILPLLPSENIADFIPVSPYQLWLAIVVVSGVSYVSYLVKKFIFPDSGILLTGVLGGIYSSTATTVILARREKEEGTGLHSVSAILLANGMMYLRVLVLVFLFNRSVGFMLTVPFLLMFGLAYGLSKLALFRAKELPGKSPEADSQLVSKNPLELRMATIFGVLFVAFGLITQAAMDLYGRSGVTGLAFFIGVFDVDPFLLYLLQQKAGILHATIALAVINATNGNNLMKMFYALSLCSKPSRKPLLAGFLVLIFVGLLVSLIFYLLYR